jgi:chitinase
VCAALAAGCLPPLAGDPMHGPDDRPMAGGPESPAPSPSPGPSPEPGTGGNPNPPAGSTPFALPALVAYWGQNGFGGANPGDPTKYEKELATVCQDNPHYGMIVLAFATSFVRTRNADGLPELNFANHCDTPFDARNPFLLRCDAIASGIESCQKLGKKVLLSLGGAAGSYGFVSDTEGETFAQTTWDMFLGGQSTHRPFGKAVLDGIDLDLEGGSTVGYTAYVKKLRAITAADTSRRWFVAGAPQCPFPDAYLGPATGRPLGDVPKLFDFVFVQFYNNYCAATNATAFADSFKQWESLSANGGPKVLIGLPATTQAANASSFVTRAALPSLLSSVKSSPAYGGVMLWDASFDQNSVTSGQTYGAFVKSQM